MFMGPLEATSRGATTGIEGVRRFLDRVWRLFFDEEDRFLPAVVDGVPVDDDAQRALHKCIDQVTQMTEDLRFNTAISQMMIFTQRDERAREAGRARFARDVRAAAGAVRAAPGRGTLVAAGPRTFADVRALAGRRPAVAGHDTVTVVVQVNGKLRDQLQVAADADPEQVKELALASAKVRQWTDGKQIVKVICVPGKLVSVVVK
jgi:leucyl-tRNA synthetase